MSAWTKASCLSQAALLCLEIPLHGAPHPPAFVTSRQGALRSIATHVALPARRPCSRRWRLPAVFPCPVREDVVRNLLGQRIVIALHAISHPVTAMFSLSAVLLHFILLFLRACCNFNCFAWESLTFCNFSTSSTTRSMVKPGKDA